MRSLWRSLPALLAITVTVLACGARSTIEEVTPAAGGGGAGGAASTERACAPNCTVGHQCCVGGCAGPAAITENDCCTCLDGEVESSTCDSGVCGGGQCKDIGATCTDDAECCSHFCDYPGAGALKKSCLVG